MGIPCYWLERVVPHRELVWCRLFEGACGPANTSGYQPQHHALKFLGERSKPRKPKRSSSSWPVACEDCGKVFTGDADATLFTLHVYEVKRTMPGGPPVGTRFHVHSNSKSFPEMYAPDGAMYNAEWIAERTRRQDWGTHGPTTWFKTDDGLSIVCRVPNGHDWHVDQRASNCTLPDDNAHHCWVRHGEPPNLTVDKAGLTCAAGAGSILTPEWHGFLRGGYLVT